MEDFEYFRKHMQNIAINSVAGNQLLLSCLLMQNHPGQRGEQDVVSFLESVSAQEARKVAEKLSSKGSECATICSPFLPSQTVSRPPCVLLEQRQIQGRKRRLVRLVAQDDSALKGKKEVADSRRHC